MLRQPRYGLIQLAGRQILPNLWLALTLQKHHMLARHEVIHSDDERESADPAEQLIQLVGQQEEVLSEVEPVAHVRDETESTMWHTQQTAAAILDEMEVAEPALDGWLLHVTGGNKPMSFGAAQLAGDPRVHGVVYRNIDGSWWVIQRDGDGHLRDRRLGQPLESGAPLAAWERALAASPARLHDVPLERLLVAQFAKPGAIARVNYNTPETNDVDLDAWLRSARRKGGGFADHVRQRGPGSAVISDGAAFECFVAHILAAAGVQRVLWGVEVFGADGSPLVETDVVACAGDRLAFYNIKIDRPTSPGKTEQIRAAHETARTFGGLSARAVLVRPNWSSSRPILEFAGVLGVTLITRNDVRTLVHALLAPLGLRDTSHPQLQGLVQALSRLPAPPSTGPAQAVFLHRHSGIH